MLQKMSFYVRNTYIRAFFSFCHLVVQHNLVLLVIAHLCYKWSDNDVEKKWKDSQRSRRLMMHSKAVPTWGSELNTISKGYESKFFIPILPQTGPLQCKAGDMSAASQLVIVDIHKDEKMTHLDSKNTKNVYVMEVAERQNKKKQVRSFWISLHLFYSNTE